MLRTALQIIIFIASVGLIILCFLQSNKGQNVLNGLANTSSSLFSTNKEISTDRNITKIIAVLLTIVFVLTIIEGAM
jgi:protein translocase SecG subunit